jgi:hypothetical protein
MFQFVCAQRLDSHLCTFTDAMADPEKVFLEQSDLHRAMNNAAAYSDPPHGCYLLIVVKVTFKIPRTRIG